MGSIADLKVALTNAIAAFNSHNIDAVQNFLAPGATVVSLRPQESFTATSVPKTAVAELTSQMDATFQLIGDPVFIPPDGDTANATIRGRATWTDPLSPAGEAIQFTFGCVFAGRWLFQSLSAFVSGHET